MNSTYKLKHFFTEKRLTTIIMLIVISWMSIFFLSRSQTYPYGDGIEYILMTEAIYNHGTTDIRTKDIEVYTATLDKMNVEYHKRYIYQSLQDFTKKIEQGETIGSDSKIPESVGFFLTKNQKFYPQHFWFYSALAIPARALLHLLDADLTKTFLMTNLVLFFIALWLLLKEKRLQYWQRLVLGFLMGFSPAAWYFVWPHVELLAGVWVFMALVYFFVDRKILATFILAVVAMHYPPIAFLALFIIANILYESWGSWNKKLFIKLFFAGVWVFVPTIYSLAIFGTPNIIVEMDYLSWEVVTLHRFFDFFLDPNQGAILAIPLVLIAFVIFLINDLIKKNLWVGYYIASSIIIMSLFFMQMKNWNHGQAVVNRYVVWVASIIIVIVAFRLFKLKSKVIATIAIVLLLGSQAYAIHEQATYRKLEWSDTKMTKLGDYFLSNYPSLYNPDPYIFLSRVKPLSISTTDSVIVYSNKDSVITKMMLKPRSYKQLISRGMNSSKVQDFIQDAKKFYDEWFYVNQKDLKALGYNQSQDTLIQHIDQQNKITLYNRLESQILSDKTWYKILEERAKESNEPIEEVIDKEIIYFMYREYE